MRTEPAEPREGSANPTPLETALGMLEEFTVMTPGQRLLTGLWSAHTWCYRQFAATPRLYFTADRPGAGKSTAMQIALALSHEPLSVGYSSQAAVYTWLDSHPETSFGIDEADQIFGVTGRRTSRPVLLAVLNDGYSQQGKVLVVRQNVAVKIDCFAPVAFAGIGTLPGPLLSRSIVIELEPAVPAQSYLPEQHNGTLGIAGAMLGDWLSKPATKRALAAAPDMAPVPGDPRFKQICAPLYAIAEAAGVTEQFLAAVTELQDSMARKIPQDRAELLIDDLAAVWPAGTGILPARDVISLLRDHDASRWRGLSPDATGARVLAGLLAERGVSSQVRAGVRGYRAADLFA